MNGFLIDALYVVGGLLGYLLAGTVTLYAARRVFGDSQKGYATFVVIWPLPFLFMIMVGFFMVVKIGWKEADQILNYITRGQ